MKTLTIAPNKPVTVALVNPEGTFDFEVGIGLYETTAGETFTLPRPAMVLLNQLDPEPGEEITITKYWSGKKGEKAEWTIQLSHRSEMARAEAGEPDSLTESLETPNPTPKPPKAPTGPPVPISRPIRRKVDTQTQPRLFDRGTGTHGPAPAAIPTPTLPALAPAARQRPGQIPANVATREILEFIQSDPNTANWSDQARQDLASTILIASFKAGYIGLWERRG
jgi:hypothetical protein